MKRGFLFMKNVVLNKKEQNNEKVLKKEIINTNELQKIKNIGLKEIIEKRVYENTNLFTIEELTIIKSNSILIEKLYLLGLIDGK